MPDSKVPLADAVISDDDIATIVDVAGLLERWLAADACEAALIPRTRAILHGMTTLTWDRHRRHASGYYVVALGLNYGIDEPRAAPETAHLARLDADFTIVVEADVDRDAPGPTWPAGVRTTCTTR
jgi:hypothetical protein